MRMQHAHGKFISAEDRLVDGVVKSGMFENFKKRLLGDLFGCEDLALSPNVRLVPYDDEPILLTAQDWVRDRSIDAFRRHSAEFWIAGLGLLGEGLIRQGLIIERHDGFGNADAYRAQWVAIDDWIWRPLSGWLPLAHKSGSVQEWERYLRGGFSEREFRYIGELFTWMWLATRLDSVVKRLAKGQSVVFRGDGMFEVVDSDPDVEASILLYDDRSSFDASGDGRTGVAGSMVVLDQPDEHDCVQLWIDHRGQPTQDCSHACVHEPIVSFFTYRDLTLGPTAVTDTDQIVAMLLAVVGEKLSVSKEAVLFHFGVAQVDGRSIVSRLKRFAKESDIDSGEVDRVLRILKEAKIVLSLGSQILVSVVLVTQFYFGLAHREKDGDNANTWGTFFEDEVQTVVDSTPWRPSSEQRKFKGRKLKGGDRQTITDIDALAVKGDTLILLSVKSYAVPEKLHSGKYWAIQEHIKKVNEALDEWDKRLATIRSNPKVLGSEFVNIKNIEGLVVLPKAPYMPIGYATEIHLGVPRACSLNELKAALNGEPLPIGASFD